MHTYIKDEKLILEIPLEENVKEIPMNIIENGNIKELSIMPPEKLIKVKIYDLSKEELKKIRSEIPEKTIDFKIIKNQEGSK